MTKQVAVIQCDQTLERVEAQQRASRPSASMRTRPRIMRIRRSSAEHAEDCDRADPFQRHLVKLAPRRVRRGCSIT